MLVTGLCFVGVTAVVKHVGSALPSSEAAFLRFVLGLVFLVPVARQLRQVKLSKTALRLVLARGMAHTLGVILWFYAMTRITVAEVTAMNYLNPVYVTLGAALFLGEKLAARRLVAIAAALVGALIILRPGFRELNSGHLAMIFTAMAFGASYLIAKRLTQELSASVVVALLSITVTIGLAPFAWAVWVPPTLGQLAWLMLVAAFATAGHYSMSRAFAAAPVSVTQPVTFLQLVWAVTLGAVVFGEPVDGWVVLGGGIIMAAVSFIAVREAMLKRRAAPPPAAPV